MFQIKESLLQNAGLGIFALRKFKKGEQIGVFYGQVVEASNQGYEPSAFVMEARNAQIVDPELSKKVFFGIHYANDPLYEETNGQKVGHSKTRRTAVLNITVPVDMIVYATQDIDFFDELYLNYAFEGRVNVPASVARTRKMN